MANSRLHPGASIPKEILAAYEKARRFLRRPEVLGVSIGAPSKNEVVAPKELAICIYVSSKIPKEMLDPASIFPTQIDGIRVDVVERVYRPKSLSISEMATRQSRTAAQIQPGLGISVASAEMGTLGLMVRDQARGNRLSILSAAHVLSPPGNPNREVLQPPWRMYGRRIGAVVQSIFDSDGDAAIAALDSNLSFRRAPIGLAAPTGIRRAVLGERVKKSGAVTGVTEGTVHAIGEFFIPFEDGTVERQQLMMCFEVRPLDSDTEEISRGGDSGSAVLADSDQNALGLLVADDKYGAADPAEFYLACHLDLVFERLALKLA